jgi:predicted small metal-binding protein
MKSVSCKDVGVDCNFTAKAESETQLMQILEKHAREKHNMKEISADMRKKIKVHIKEVAVR